MTYFGAQPEEEIMKAILPIPNVNINPLKVLTI